MRIVLLLISIFISSLQSGCSKKQRLSKTPGTSISVNVDRLHFDEADSAGSISVLSDAKDYRVSISDNAPWCTYQKKGDQLVIVVAAMPSVVAERTATVKLTAGSGARKTTAEITVSQKRRWKLVWEDNFDNDGPVDPLKWTLVTRGTPDWKKHLTPSKDYAFVEGGKLILKAVKRADGYHAGGIESFKKFSFKYGKVEVKAKLSSGKGTWPAIWMMPEKSVFGGWPRSGEIDIMEHLNNDRKTYQVIHSHYIDNLGITNDPPNSHTQAFSVGQFNTFGIEWFPERIDFLVNGSVTFTYPKKAGLSADMLQWPFSESFHLILNQALGGSWVGTIDDSILPVQTEIEYVRVYGLSHY